MLGKRTDIIITTLFIVGFISVVIWSVGIFDQNQQNEKLKSCKLSGGELVDDGWIGKDTGSNYCNQCKCMNGALACTKMACLDNDSSVKAPVRDVSQQDDSKAKSEEDERKKDDEERKEIEEDERKKEEANQPESNSKKDVKNKLM